MVYNEIDARNLNCPLPVINTKKVLDQISSGSITAIVNSEAALENILTLAQNMGCGVEVEQRGSDYHIHISKNQTIMECQMVPIKDEVVVFASSKMGRGDDQLGGILSKAFFYTLVEAEEVPRTIIFLNSGVELACEGSPVLEHLMALEKRGIEVLSCGTCLDFFALKEKLCVGQITNMYTIWDKMTRAEKVINF